MRTEGGDFDGIVVKNLYDFDTGVKGNVYVALNPEQIKSTTNLTPHLIPPISATP